MNNINKTVRELLNQNGIEYVSCLCAEELSIIQEHLYPEGIKSAFFWLIPYYTGKHENRNVSLYAVSRDYHVFSRALAESMGQKLKEMYPDEQFYFFCDSSPVNEVAAAVKAGLGVIGKNRLLINEKYGSFVFIGSMLTSLEAQSEFIESEKHTCLECGACLKACDFLSGKREYCFSELNQRKNVTDEELEIIRLKKIRWGCDECQEVCPMNKHVEFTPISFFREETIEIVTPEILENMSKMQFKERAYSWRGKKVIFRNVE